MAGETGNSPAGRPAHAHALTYTDPKTGLAVHWTAIEYHDFPTVEWTLALKNTGTADTPLLSDVRAVDTRFQRGKEGEFTLHYHTGSPCSPNDYEPHTQPLGRGRRNGLRPAAAVRPTATCPISTSSGQGKGRSSSWAGPASGPPSSFATTRPACRSAAARN